MLPEAADLVVVGAGDAGPCTARAAADRSVSVLVQERTPEGTSAAATRAGQRRSKNRPCDGAIWVTSPCKPSYLGYIDLINDGALGMSVIRDDHLTNLVAIEEITPGIWDRFMNVNLSGAWYLTRAAVPGRKRAGWGRIITITTIFFTMLRGKFHPSGPAKAGLGAMAAGHAGEFADDGITVNVVVPGSPAGTAMVPEVSGYRRADLMPPAKMVHPLLWLRSEPADGVTGNRYVAAHRDESASIDEACITSEAPIGWPDLADAPVWPGGKPQV